MLAYQGPMETPQQPLLLRQSLMAALQNFPGNPQILALLIATESSCQITGRVRRFVDSVLIAGSAPVALALMAVAAEMMQPVLAIHRVRALLERYACVSVVRFHIFR